MRASRSGALIAISLLLFLAACDTINDTLNDAIPEIAISGGVLGLGGADGTEISGTFSDAGKGVGVEATASLQLSSSFDDLNSGDFSNIESLNTTIGLALSTDNTALTLVRGSAAQLPDMIHATGWTLSWNISDNSGSVTTPSGSVMVSNLPAVFTRMSGCASTAARCGYSASNAAALQSLFPIAADDEAYLDNFTAVVFEPEGGGNTPNSMSLSLGVTVTETAAQLAGMSVSLRIGEYETTIAPILF